MHALRLGFQGIELSTDGRLSLPMQDEQRSYLLEVRHGRVPFDEVVSRLEDLEADLEGLVSQGSVLPDEPDTDRVNSLLSDLYRLHWGWTEKEQIT